MRRASIVSEFVMHGYLRGFGSSPLRSDTIRGYLHGINHFFRASALEFPSTHPHVALLLQGLSRVQAPRQPKHPVSIELLGACLSLLDFSNPRHRALWGVVCISFFFLLCRSEIAAISRNKFQWFALKTKDLIVVDDRGTPVLEYERAHGVQLLLTGSKANQLGPASTRFLKCSGDPYLCPVRAALFLIQARQPSDGSEPIAVIAPDQTISSSDISSLIKAAAAKLGYDPRAFGTHSLRAGGATMMYRAGISPMTIQFHGRWKSDAFKTYTRLCKESVASLAHDMIQGQVKDSTLDRVRQPSEPSQGVAATPRPHMDKCGWPTYRPDTK